MSAPGLYGIENSNREGDDLWGKNQFNSTFPISLCCYMRDHGVPPVYIAVDKDGEIRARDNDGVSMENVFGTPKIGAGIRFDVFAWSNLAILKIPVDSWKGKKNKVTRSLREAVRHLWCFRQLLTVGKINYNQIYRGIALGNQTDKSFALNGTRTIKYMDHPRLRKPHFSSDILPALILNGGENRLSPERRFDATVFYTCKALLQRNPDG